MPKVDWAPRKWIIPPGLQKIMARYNTRCDALIKRAKAGDPKPLLIKGETGVGKSFFTEFFVHKYLSQMPDKKVKVVNCAAFTKDLLESELFGHKKGSFTGAISDKLGLFEYVGDGVLVLEELGELSKPLQAKLLTAIETKRFSRVGELEDREVSSQIVATTNVVRKKIRDDLWFRCDTFNVPEIALRREDIFYYIENFDSELMHLLTEGAALSILCYNWNNGNIREIESLCTSLRDKLEIFSTMHEKDGFSGSLNEYINHHLGLLFYTLENDASDFDILKAERLIDAFKKNSIRFESIETVLNSNNLGFDCRRRKVLTNKAPSSKTTKKLYFDEGKEFSESFIVVENDLFESMYLGFCVFCRLFLQNKSANTDILDFSSLLLFEYRKDKLSQVGLSGKITFPYKHAPSYGGNISGTRLAQFFNVCRYISYIRSDLKRWPKCYIDAHRAALSYLTGINDISENEMSDLNLLLEKNQENIFLSMLFGTALAQEADEDAITNYQLDDLRSLYYETVCNKIGIAHGYQKKLAKIAGRAEGTISTDLKKLNLDAKFEKPNYYPQKRLIIRKPR